MIMIDTLQILAEDAPLLGAFVAGLILMYKVKNNDLKHLMEHLEKIENLLEQIRQSNEDTLKRLLEEVIRRQ